MTTDQESTIKAHRRYLLVGAILGLGASCSPSQGADQIQGDAERDRVAEGEMVTGALDVERSGAWRLVVEPGRRVRVDVQSDDFDPVLHVFGPGPADSLYDDDGGDGVNPRLCFTPSESDGYRVVVTEWGRRASRYDAYDGAYTLSVNAWEGQQCGMAANASSDRMRSMAELRGDPRLGRLRDTSFACGVAGEEPTSQPNCETQFLRVSDDEHLEFDFVVTNEHAESLTESGHWAALRSRYGRVTDTLRFDHPGDHWLTASFVPIRRQRYLADLDGDGHLEFAVYLFDAGNAPTWKPLIFSLKDEIEPWGDGVILVGGSRFVRLDCAGCSVFNLQKCGICR